jgi:hypothetical protein
MKVKHKAQKRTRINYGFIGFYAETECGGWWYNKTLKEWQHNPKMGQHTFGSHQDCDSVRAFRRKLKSAPKGVTFVLVSKWVGHDVYGVGSKEY